MEKYLYPPPPKLNIKNGGGRGGAQWWLGGGGIKLVFFFFSLLVFSFSFAAFLAFNGMSFQIGPPEGLLGRCVLSNSKFTNQYNAGLLGGGGGG